MGRDKKNERRRDYGTMMHLSVMRSEAWRALGSGAQALYVWLRLEWRGADYNNNGRIALSVRQAAKAMGVSTDTAARAFHDLQAKGFILVKAQAHLGTKGKGKSNIFELTEIAMPGASSGSRRYKQWRKGQDFAVVSPRSNNPTGRNGRNIPSSKS